MNDDIGIKLLIAVIILILFLLLIKARQVVVDNGNSRLQPLFWGMVFIAFLLLATLLTAMYIGLGWAGALLTVGLIALLIAGL